MVAFLKKHHRLLFYGSWILLGILQANFTELQDDEAYYWVYSLFPAAGYFDHPPMIALLIKAGTVFQTTALFVRIFPFILNVLSIYITEKLTTKKNPFLFYAICYSIAILHLAGFFAVPDIPLVFFSALLFLLYKRYLLNNSWTNAVLIGIVSALLLYSKYHGVLVLFFILLSNIKIVTDKKIIAAGFIALVLFIPHLLWQYQHNWVTFRYHLSERSSDSYDFLYTTDYLLGQLLLLGPLAGFIFWPISFIYIPDNPLDKAFKWTAV
ncbi:MAG TPA: glycosyltransferase family 39 protein, partial [Flavisolibacter sp.]|nr:glycosyltransferase family 39 protein [Flavisolibacter sp.]